MLASRIVLPSRTVQTQTLKSRVISASSKRFLTSGSRGNKAHQATIVAVGNFSNQHLMDKNNKLSRSMPWIGRRGYASLPSHKVIELPSMSPTMETGNVGAWKKNVGDKISPGDVLVEIETDKAQMDFECQEEGYLAKILVDKGTKDVAVGRPICVIVDSPGDVAAFANFVAEGGSTSAPAASAPPPAAPAAAPTPASNYPSHNVVGLPALSPTMESGNVGQWKKKEGDQVQAGDVLVDVETDKAQMDFECQDEGYIAKILVPSGTKDVKVGQPLFVLVPDKDSVPKFASFSAAPAAAPSKPAAAPAAPATPSPPKPSPHPASAPSSAPVARTSSGGRVFASPLAKKLAAERSIPLEEVVGTGPNGRITKSDLDSYVPRPKAAPSASVGGIAIAPLGVRPGTPPAGLPATPFTDVELTNMRKVIAKRLLQSKTELPHFYLTMEVEMDKVLKLREILNAQGADKYKLSVNDFVIKASSLALRDVPDVNSGWNDTSIRQFNTVDICVAVATPTGLITPIVKNADSKGLAGISNEVKELAGRARKNKLLPHEFQGGSFTISNLGMFGIKNFTAIINPPQSAILAVGGTQHKLVYDEESELGFRQVAVMEVTLSCDHRVVDGAVGAQWLGKFKGYLENPLLMIA